MPDHEPPPHLTPKFQPSDDGRSLSDVVEVRGVSVGPGPGGGSGVILEFASRSADGHVYRLNLDVDAARRLAAELLGALARGLDEGRGEAYASMPQQENP